MSALEVGKALEESASTDAMHVVEELVTATGSSLMTRDFPAFAARFRFPHFIVTELGEREVTSADELRQTFQKVVDHYQLLGVDHMERFCGYAEFVSKMEIHCIHETRLYRGKNLVQQPFSVRSRLTYENDAWKIYSADYSISDSLRYVRALIE